MDVYGIGKGYKTHQVGSDREVDPGDRDMKSSGDGVQRREVNTRRQGREETSKGTDRNHSSFLIESKYRVLFVDLVRDLNGRSFFFILSLRGVLL